MFTVGDRHLARVPVFTDAIQQTLKPFNQSGMKTYLVSFEPSFPAGLERRINLSSYDSPDMAHFLRTKFCELKKRLPMLNGVTVYAADDWPQRADSRFQRTPPVFSGPLQFAALATVLAGALRSCGLELLMQTWTAGGTSGLASFVKVCRAAACLPPGPPVRLPRTVDLLLLLILQATPPDITLVSHLGTSFRDQAPFNSVLPLCPERRTLVFADAYRENVRARPCHNRPFCAPQFVVHHRSTADHPARLGRPLVAAQPPVPGLERDRRPLRRRLPMTHGV